MRLLELFAYHGTSTGGAFAATHTGTNSTTFGAYQSNRVGVFFSNNPEFAALYGNVNEYDLNIHNPATNLSQLAYEIANELDAHDPNERNLWLAFMYQSRDDADAWGLFEEELGEYFVPWLIKQGYDSAQFTEYNEDDNGKELESLTTVVFDPKLIKPIRSESTLSENTMGFPDKRWIVSNLRNNPTSRVPYNVLSAYIVGSVAKKTNNNESDLDIAIIIPSSDKITALARSERYHEKFTNDNQKPRWNGVPVDFQFFYNDDPELASYQKIKLF